MMLMQWGEGGGGGSRGRGVVEAGSSDAEWQAAMTVLMAQLTIASCCPLGFNVSKRTCIGLLGQLYYIHSAPGLLDL
jgi:hypothetical protein